MNNACTWNMITIQMIRWHFQLGNMNTCDISTDCTSFTLYFTLPTGQCKLSSEANTKIKKRIYFSRIKHLVLRSPWGIVSNILNVSATRSGLQKKCCLTKYLSTVILFCEVSMAGAVRTSWSCHGYKALWWMKGYQRDRDKTRGMKWHTGLWIRTTIYLSVFSCHHTGMQQSLFNSKHGSMT